MGVESEASQEAMSCLIVKVRVPLLTPKLVIWYGVPCDSSGQVQFSRLGGTKVEADEGQRQRTGQDRIVILPCMAHPTNATDS